jgi:hypothetical protein
MGCLISQRDKKRHRELVYTLVAPPLRYHLIFLPVFPLPELQRKKAYKLGDRKSSGAGRRGVEKYNKRHGTPWEWIRRKQSIKGDEGI